MAHVKKFFHPMMWLAGIGFFGGCLSVRLPHVQIRTSTSDTTLEWVSVVEEALQKNPDILQAKRNIDSSARSRDIAFGDYLPEVSGELNRSTTRASTNTPARDAFSVDIVGSQSLFNGFTTTGNFISAKKDLEAARWAYQDTSALVRLRLRSAYVELLRLKRLLEVSQRIANRRKQNADLIELRYQAGREHLGSALRAKAIAEQSAFEVRQTIRRMESQSLRLGREMGGDFEWAAQVKGNLELMVPAIEKANPDYSSLAEQTPQVINAVKIAESYKAEVLSAQGALWPQVDANATYGYEGTKATADLRDAAFLGLRISLPFFNGGQNIAAIRKARSDYKAALEFARSTRDEILTQLSEAWAQYVDAVEQVEVRQHFLEAARKRSEIVRSEYTTGLVNFQDFDIAEQDLSDSETRYVQSLSDVLIQKATWERLIGLTLEEAVRGI